MGGRCAIHVPSCGRQMCLLLLVAIAATPSLASLDQGLLGHSIWYEVCVCLWPLRIFFSYMNIVGTGGFSGRAIHVASGCCSYWICPLVTPTPCQHWGIFWEAIMQPWDVVLLDMPSSHSHSLSALGLFWEGHHAASGLLFYWICL